jgi:hypothetical protein
MGLRPGGPPWRTIRFLDFAPDVKGMIRDYVSTVKGEPGPQDGIVEAAKLVLGWVGTKFMEMLNHSFNFGAIRHCSDV